MRPKGTLIAIGGNEDKGFEEQEENELDFIDEGILSHFVQYAGGQDAKIKVITSASKIPLEIGATYEESFAKLSCTDVEVLHIQSKKEAEQDQVIEKIKEADAVLFSGGDQRRIVDFFLGTKTLEVMKERYTHEDFVIAGTSAGAAAMSKEMICGGKAEHAMLKDSVCIQEGLGLLPKVIFDTHFIKRGRFGRLTEAVGRYPKRLGVGLGEDTGIVITEGREFRTIGSGMVLIFDGKKLKHNNIAKLSKGTPITIGHMIVHVMANNDKYDLKKRKLSPLPLDGEFI